MDYHRPAPHSAGPASLINDTGIPALSALLPLDNRLFWPAVAIGGLLILAFVLYLQHVRGFAPCSLCIFIRLDVLGLVLAGIVGSLARVRGSPAASPRWHARRQPGRDLPRLVAGRGRETGCPGHGQKMFMGFPEWIPLDTWLPQVFQPEGCAAKWSGPCSASPWRSGRWRCSCSACWPWRPSWRSAAAPPDSADIRAGTRNVLAIGWSTIELSQPG